MPKCTTAGRFPVAENCSCFYTCDQVDGKLTTKLHKCPGTSLYSPATKKCSYRCNVTPTEVSSSNSNKFGYKILFTLVVSVDLGYKQKCDRDRSKLLSIMYETRSFPVRFPPICFCIDIRCTF